MKLIRKTLNVQVARSCEFGLLPFAFLVACILCAHLSSAEQTDQVLAKCDQASNNLASISSLGSPSPLTFKVERRHGHSVATGHVYARNDSGFALSRWCFRGYFLDYLGREQKLTLNLKSAEQTTDNTCITLNVNAGLIQDFLLSIEVNERALPISGFVSLQASGVTLNQNASGGKNQKTPSPSPSELQVRQETQKCIATAKEISQSVVLTSAQSASYAGELILLTGVIALVFLTACLWRFRNNLMASMGASQWTFSSSAATNLTFVGSLLGMVLVSSSVPDFPHIMSKQTFVVLGLAFAVLAGLSPVLYNFCCKPVGLNATNPQLVDFEGWVWLFLVADALTIWAVCGQFGTLGLLFNEFATRQLIPCLSGMVAWLLVAAVVIAFLLYCFRSARFYVEQHPARKPQKTKEAKELAEAEPKRIPAPRWTAL